MKDLSRFHCYPITNEDLTQDMGTHLYNSFHSLERILEGNQELSKEVLKKFGGHVEFNGCKSPHLMQNKQNRKQSQSKILLLIRLKMPTNKLSYTNPKRFCQNLSLFWKCYPKCKWPFPVLKFTLCLSIVL